MATFYYQFDDPYSNLLLVPLMDLLNKIDLQLDILIVPENTEDYTSGGQLRYPYFLKDTMELRNVYNLPSLKIKALTDYFKLNQFKIKKLNKNVLTTLKLNGIDGLKTLIAIINTYTLDEIKSTLNKTKLQENLETLIDNGHYQAGMIHYNDDWFWGIDRYSYFLDTLKHMYTIPNSFYPKLHSDRLKPIQNIEYIDNKMKLTVYFSFRSPYSWLAIYQIEQLKQRYPIHVDYKPILPMVRRNLSVPFLKRMYIINDCKREARKKYIPFGENIKDPLEKIDTIFDVYHETENKDTFIYNTMKSIWSLDQEITFTSESSSLESHWLTDVNENKKEINNHWGVPIFKFGDWFSWGQDRIPILELHIQQSLKSMSKL
jgi:2-hydroxychromene-2-carboxylate isomerase